MKTRAAVLWIALSGLAVGLTGCTPGANVFARSVDGTAELLLCSRLEIVEFEISIADSDTSMDYTRVWSVSGETELDFGSRIRYGEPPFGMTGDVATPIELEDVRLRVAISTSDGHTRVASFPTGSLVGDEWRNEKGEEVTNPC